MNRRRRRWRVPLVLLSLGMLLVWRFWPRQQLLTGRATRQPFPYQEGDEFVGWLSKHDAFVIRSSTQNSGKTLVSQAVRFDLTTKRATPLPALDSVFARLDNSLFSL